MFEKEKEVDVTMFGYDKPVIVKRLTAGERRDLNNALTRVNRLQMKGQDVIGDLSPGDTDLIAAKAYFKEGPFTVEEFPNLDWELVSLIAEAGDELNSPLAAKTVRGPSLE